MDQIDIERDPRFLKLVRQYKCRYALRSRRAMGGRGCDFIFFLAPISTIAISMQLSVKANQHLLSWKPSAQDDNIIRKIEMEKVELRRLAKQKHSKTQTGIAKQIQAGSRERSLVKQKEKQKLLTESQVNKAIQKSKHRWFDSKIIQGLRDYRRQWRTEQLHRMSGQVGKNQPYRAPIYKNYRECIRGLYQQGFLGFYKGNLIRQLRLCFLFLFYPEVRRIGESIFGTRARNHHYKSVMISSLMASLLIYPFYTIESRFILQNRLPGFYTYRSILAVYQNVTKKQQLFQGFLATIPIVLCLSLIDERGERPSYLEPLKGGILLNLLLYPLITVQRRLQCQSNETFMLPVRYRSYGHAFRDMYRVEGLLSFYRGFPLHLLAFIGFLIVVRSPKMSLEESVKCGNVSKEVFQIYKNSK